MKGKSAFLLLNRAEAWDSLVYLLLLLFLPTQLGKHFWPDYTILSGFRVDYLSPTVYLTDLLIGLLFVLWLRKQRINKESFKTLLPFLLLVLFLLVSLPFSTSVPAGLYALLKVIELLFVAWYTREFLLSSPLSPAIPRVVSLTVCGESLLALLQLLNQGALGGVFYLLGERSISTLTPGAATTVLNGQIFLRSYGTFSHPNVLAGFLLLSLVYVSQQRAAFFLRRFGQILLLTTLFLGSVGLLTTLSRLPLFLWGLYGMYHLLRFVMRRAHSPLSFSPRHLSSKTVLPLIIGSLCVLLLSPLLVRFMTRLATSRVTEEAVVVREDLNQIALSVIARYPLRGVGLGNFLYQSIQYKDPAAPLYFAVQPVHNIFLLIGAETGVLGFFLFTWFLFLIFFRTDRSGKVAIVLICILGSFDHYFLTLQQGQLLLAFLIGYCWSRRGKPENAVPPRD